MNYFRTVCIMHRREDSYKAYYLKGLFKWIGLSYFDYCVDDIREDSCILLNSKGNKFDVVITLICEEEKWQEELRDDIDCKMYYINTGKEDILSLCLGQILDDLFEKKADYAVSYKLFNDLAEIYKNDLAEIIYSYTFTLLSKAKDAIKKQLYNKLKTALMKLDRIVNEKLAEEIKGYEYYLYAKMYLKRRINELYFEMFPIVEYDVAKCIKETNSIYKYDEKFIQADYLKAKFAKMDIMYKLYAECYFKTCIDFCTNDICRSFYRYELGKYYESRKECMAARDQFELALRENGNSFRIIFKLALRYIDIDFFEKAKTLLIALLEKLNFGENYLLLGPREWEYVFKTYMLLGYISPREIDSKYYKGAAQVIELLNKVKEGTIERYNETCFYKLYKEKEIIRLICDCMEDRFGKKKLELKKYFV